METVTVKAVLEVDFDRGKHGAVVCAGDVLGWLPEGVQIGRNEAEAIYEAFCAHNFKTLSVGSVEAVLGKAGSVSDTAPEAGKNG